MTFTTRAAVAIILAMTAANTFTVAQEDRQQSLNLNKRRTAAQREELRSCVRWAVGLEHESMLVHRKEGSMEEFAIDANKILREMARYGPIHGLTKRQHALAVKANDDGAEFSGRRCAASIDLVYKTMMESVSGDALELTFDGAFDQIQEIDNTFLEMANAHPFIAKAMKDVGLGPITQPLTGMSAQLGMYQRTGGQWHSCATCGGTCEVKDYTGSYHMSLSLPTTVDGWVARDESILEDRNTCARPAEDGEEDEASLRSSKSSRSSPTKSPFSRWFAPSDEEIKKQQWEEWIEANMNLGNMVQWVEPLLVSIFGSADAESVCDAGHFTEGSFRTMRTGWGVPGTTDVRTFRDGGIGRYIKNNFDWMFPEDTTTVPSAYREALSGCIEDGMGADIRTKTSVDEHHLKPGETLPPMEVGRGIEIRIFDNFPIESMPQVYRMISLVAEAGRHFTAPEYIYDNADWADAIQSVMREGWNAILPEGYVRGLVTALNLPATFVEELGQNFQSFHVYTKVFEALWDANADGFWTGLLLDEIPEELPTIENPNRNSWELGAINMGFTPDKVLETLGLERGLPRNIQFSELELLDPVSCGEDSEDLVYLAERFGMVSNIQLNSEGSIESFFFQPVEEWDSSYATSPICFSGFAAEIQ